LVVLPEARDALLLAAYEIGGRAVLREPREDGERGVVRRLDDGGVADERETREATTRVAAAVERAAVQRADETVVAYERGHEDRVHGARGEEGERLRLVRVGERADGYGSRLVRLQKRARALLLHEG